MNATQIKTTDSLVKEMGGEESLEKIVSLENFRNVRQAPGQSKRMKSIKKNFSLYDIYKDVKNSIAQAEIVLKEYFETENDVIVIKADAPHITLNPAGEALAGLSAETKQMLEQAMEIYANQAHRPDEIKNAWIAEKVITNRYSARGMNHVIALNDVADEIFSLNSICVALQVTLTKFIETNPEV